MSNGEVGTCDTSTRSCLYGCPAGQKTCVVGSVMGCSPLDGCCSDTDCGDSCQTCSSDHVCVPTVSADDPSGRCPGTCDASGACRSKRGQSCATTAGGCASDSTCSPDGICCDQACTASCLACDIPGSVGTCSPVASGAPHGSRIGCDGAGTECGGACGDQPDGACVYPTGSCGSPTCSSGTLVSGGTCMSGSCVTTSSTTCGDGCNAAANACAVFTTFPIPNLRYPAINCSPARLAAGPDGNVWFTENNCAAIGSVTPAGVITEYSTGLTSSSPFGIVSGVDGNLWFTEESIPKVGRITTAGVITEYAEGNVYSPSGIAESASGLLWVTGYNSVGSFSTAAPSSVTWTPPVTETTPYIFDITPGPDGNMWFIEENTGNVGRVTPTGAITEFMVVAAVPIGTTPSHAALRAIVTGPDGNLWFTEDFNNAIGRITPDGLSVQHFPIPTPNCGAEDITVGPDGNVWFTEYSTGKIGRVTPTGTVTEFSLPSPGLPTGIVTGPDGNLWIGEGYIGLTPATGADIRRFMM